MINITLDYIFLGSTYLLQESLHRSFFVLFYLCLKSCHVLLFFNINEHYNSHDISNDKSVTKLWQKLINHLLCDVLMCCAVFVVANVCHLTFLYREPVLTVYLAKGTQILILMLSMFHTQFSDRNSLD